MATQQERRVEQSELYRSLPDQKRGVGGVVIHALKMWRQLRRQQLDQRLEHEFEKETMGKFPLYIAKAIKGRSRLMPEEMTVIREITKRDWTKECLKLSDPIHRELAAQMTALGAVLCHGFGNFYAVTAHPHEESIIYVNKTKGRPERQVGSATTTREHIKDLFDWTKLPSILSKHQIIDFIDEVYDQIPFGFRGPAAAGIPELLTSSEDGGKRRTTQIIAPGYHCPSNALIARVLELTGREYLFITSANLSHNKTGTAEEPAHWKMKGIQEDFGRYPGFIMVAHDDDNAVSASYGDWVVPMSTTIVSFDRCTRDESNRPALYLERHGSIHITHVAKIAAKFGLGIELGPNVKSRLPVRSYAQT